MTKETTVDASEVVDFPVLHSEKIRIIEALRQNREIINPGDAFLTLGFKTETGDVDTAVKVTIPRLLGIILAALPSEIK